MDRDNNVVELGPHNNMTVEQALGHGLRQAQNGDLKHVLVIGVTPNDAMTVLTDGEFVRKDINWCMDVFKQNLLTQG